jgi:CubicO group peptidase (beta-lactamase class C family)
MIRHDSYPLTAGDETDPAASRRISWSVAKSFLSVLIGVLVDDGTIPDLDAPVTQIRALTGRISLRRGQHPRRVADVIRRHVR